MSSAPTPTAFAQVMAKLAEAGDRVAATLKEQGCADGEVESSVAMLGALMFGYLNHLWADVDHPRFMPAAGFYTHIGTPNPDTFYRSAAIDGAGIYQLTGFRGTAPEVTIMPFGGPTPSGLQTFAPLDLDELSRGTDGRFEVILSVERPPGLDGDWWNIDADVRSLMLRSVSPDWGEHREPLVAIVRIDAAPRRERSSHDEVTARLATLPTIVERSVAYGLRKVDQLRAAGVVNRLTSVDYSGNGGLTGQWYHEGVFDLAADDVLLMEVRLPAACGFSLSLTDPLFCTVDWTHAQSSLNHRQASVDHDGVLRIVITCRDPGVPNWLDTTGYQSGVVQCRWTGCDEAPEPLLRLVSHADVREQLPAGTARISPEDRDRTLRVRAAAAQLRALW